MNCRSSLNTNVFNLRKRMFKSFKINVLSPRKNTLVKMKPSLTTLKVRTQKFGLIVRTQSRNQIEKKTIGTTGHKACFFIYFYRAQTTKLISSYITTSCYISFFQSIVFLFFRPVNYLNCDFVFLSFFVSCLID